MRVLMTADTVGGVWSYAVGLASALERHGVEVDLATMGARPTPDQRLEAAALSNLRLHERACRLEWMDDPWEDVRQGGEWLLELEALLAPDVVHLNGYASGALPWRASTLVVGHSCVCSWWRSVRGEEAPPKYERYRRAARAGLRAAELVVAPTRAMLRELETYYGPLPEWRVIPNACDPLRHVGREKEPYVLAAGRVWDEAKNLGALARIASALPWQVYVAGEARHPDGGEVPLTEVRGLGRLLPRALGRWYSAASIFAHPARYEPFGLAPLEAGLAGCALVLGDLDSLREVWGEAALFVDPGDDSGLRNALLRLIEDPALRARYGRAAMKRALEYSPSAMAAAYLDAYRSLADGRRAEPDPPALSEVA